MANYSEDPVRHVISFRVNSEELKMLELLAGRSASSMSDFMRRQVQRLKEQENEE